MPFWVPALRGLLELRQAHQAPALATMGGGRNSASCSKVSAGPRRHGAFIAQGAIYQMFNLAKSEHLLLICRRDRTPTAEQSCEVRENIQTLQTVKSFNGETAHSHVSFGTCFTPGQLEPHKSFDKQISD